MTTPPWALTLAYWLHMLATVVWIGGLAALALMVLPAARRALDGQAYAALLNLVQHRLERLGWFCLILLAGTGLLQLSANPHYQGFLAVQNLWAAAILVKHLLFLAMIALSAYYTWGLLPHMRRLALRKAQADKTGVDAGHLIQTAADLQRQETWLLRLNLLLAVLILALTAVARAA